jgi:hypothetical protein
MKGPAIPHPIPRVMRLCARGDPGPARRGGTRGKDAPGRKGQSGGHGNRERAMRAIMAEPRLEDLLADDTMRRLMDRDGVTEGGLRALVDGLRLTLFGAPQPLDSADDESAMLTRAGSRFWHSINTSRAMGAATAEPPPPCSISTEQAYRGA